MATITQSLISSLFLEDEGDIYCVLDGASVPDLQEQLLAHGADHECLYRGELEPDIAEVAPYLVRLEPGSTFVEWVAEQGWGKHWGVFAVAAEDLLAMRRHFRRFLIAHDSEGKKFYFRYYDPRVLRLYLPTCNEEELAAFFGPVVSYMMEDKDPMTLLDFRFVSGGLKQHQKNLISARRSVILSVP